MKKLSLLISVITAITLGCNTNNNVETSSVADDTSKVEAETSLILKNENHFKNLRQLTNGGDNAEAYWSFNDEMLVMQVTNEKWNTSCDQIFYFNPQKDNVLNNPGQLVSTGKGRTTCAYFLPGDTTIVYASTHLDNDLCPPVPAPREDHKYVWPVYSQFDIFVTDLNGNIIKQLTETEGYDAEATVSPKGDLIVFTSMRSGDLELYTMNIDGSNVLQITDELGYDGGAFFSPDGKKLIFRASRPKTKEKIDEYKSLLSEGLVMPTQMELFICNIDGSDMKQITELGKANWCPFFLPSGEKIIFSSNHSSERGFPFNLYMINLDGSGLEQITNDDTFDAFPVFSNSGKYLVFSSNRNNGGTRETNLFIAEWKE